MALTQVYYKTVGRSLPRVGPRFPHLTNTGKGPEGAQGPIHSFMEGQHPCPKRYVRPFSGASPSQHTP